MASPNLLSGCWFIGLLKESSSAMTVELEVYVLYHEYPVVSLIIKNTSIPSHSNNFSCVEICMYSGTKHIINRYSSRKHFFCEETVQNGCFCVSCNAIVNEVIYVVCKVFLANFSDWRRRRYFIMICGSRRVYTSTADSIAKQPLCTSTLELIYLVIQPFFAS